MNNRCLRITGVLFSMAVGIELVIMFFFILDINPANVPISATIFFWIVNSILSGCVVDEIFKKKFHIRLIRRKIIAHF
ncbi:MAG: hypothetical protein ACI4E1_07105 [Lachnospira sp.]